MATDRELDGLAADFLEAFRKKTFPGRSGVDVRTLTTEEAYRVQDKVIAARVRDGDGVMGFKVGCTSKPIRKQFGLSEPISGRLMASGFHLFDPQDLKWNSFLNCAVEPEFLLWIDRDITGEQLDDEFLLSSISSVSPAIEVHHHRFWFQPPSQQELIASNGIHACVVGGGFSTDTRAFDLPKVEVTLEIDGETRARGVGRDIMGGPIESLRWLASHLRARGQLIRKEQFVIPGSPVPLIPVPAGSTVKATVAGMEAVAHFKA